ncbi:hypothetical protein F4777DRAFT_575049 [Nemania sp. FL0916]|nr:hypothetical protein F4777DRAFT_575049 [Nemania sp. FL0916]
MSSNNHSEQPDFDVVGRHVIDLGHQVMRCTNIPQVEQNKEMLNDIRQLMQGARELRSEMQKLRKSLDEVREAVDLDYNSLARSLNSNADNPSSAVQPLKNLTTHQMVDIPRTRRDVASLTDAQVERHLTALGQSPLGNTAERKKQLMRYLGLPMVG